MQKIILPLAILFSVAISSCKKKDPEPTPQQKLQVKWAPQSIFISVSGISQTIAVDACEKNSILEFLANNTANYTDGCNNNAVSTDAYSLTSDGKKLTWDGETYDVDELTTSSLKISQSETLSGITSKQGLIFVKK